jgi:polyhydroxyalkanoate synthesis regulator protein
VTRGLLISILMDETIGGDALFSEELIRATIRFCGNPMQDFFRVTLDQSHKLLNSIWPMLASTKSGSD